MVRRIVANLRSNTPAAIAAFYRDLLDLDIVMDAGWIVTLASGKQMAPQLSIASQGGSDTEVPVLSIEVDDVDAVLDRARLRGDPIIYGPADEPWGVRRFYVRDPDGHVLNILSHTVLHAQD